MTSNDNALNESTDWPELIFGLVGPIGVNMRIVEQKLREALVSVGYNPQSIRLTDLMSRIAVEGIEIDDGSNPVAKYESKIRYANAVRKKCENDAALAALAIDESRNCREAHWKVTDPSPDAEKRPVERAAYILRQLKRAEEILLLRKVYGRKFIQISVHLSEKDRKKNLERDIALNNANLTPKQCTEYAESLVETDMSERSDIHGQRIEEVFHMGDAFISGRNEDSISRTTDRFIAAFFGKNSISPTKDEYGAYMAASASLRSIDLSRQIGAAIFSIRGEVISLGCNEVPKFGGGTYWTEDDDPHRDFDDGIDANRTEKNRIIFDFLRTLEGAQVLRDGSSAATIYSDENVRKRIKDAAISDITEFGRMTHAEMTALCDAARLGRATAGATIFVTTFPCHNCAKHIIASGIRRVVFIEPYPKSKALSLHEDSVSLDDSQEKRVIFEHFVGISPRRYRDIFEKTSRRGGGGQLSEWYEDSAKPRLEDKGPSYIWNEESGIFSTLEKVVQELGIELENQQESKTEAVH
ncbi:anti-phage dCTP deaminase [Mesorhizobium sp.]|uniref:anti-phage dCTP deaminase n=1 Tax=Mesorhizobium sp. TaxID=1871066 RepID=UPI0025D92DCD|nr:anti-phage dCTP deaminase [Mesorhizobium sp.]